MGGAGAGGMPGGAAGSGGRGGGGGAAGSGGSAGSGSFTLTSPDHMEGAMFADPYTCAEAGFNGSILPELRWSGAPSGTMSFAITFIDRTLAPANMNGFHWVIWNIPATTMSLPRGFTNQMSIMAQENRDFLGPCPNFGGGNAMTDRYEFTIYALSQASITVTPATGTMAVANAETMLEAMNLAKAKLSGMSNASPP
jgi:Raf kinase inhibitor-like YbhB/YbcL family protein